MRKGKKFQDEQHIRFYYKMMESAAYKALSFAAIWLLLELRKQWAGGDANKIKLSYSKIKKIRKIHSRIISRAFIELEVLGFINIVKRGGLFKGASVYALSDHWQEISEDPEKLKQAKIILKRKLKRIKRRVPLKK